MVIEYLKIAGLLLLLVAVAWLPALLAFPPRWWRK